MRFPRGGPSIASVIRDELLTNTAYGFPRGHARAITPRVLAVVHITANMAVAQDQRDYANRVASPGPSAHYYIDRDGSGIRAIDAARYAAWSNGDMQAPLLSNAGVKYLNALRVAGHNPNEGCYLEIECVGTATTAGQWTDAQFETVARLIADASLVTGLAISAQTVLPHAWINTVDRAHCPSLNAAAHVARLVSLAQELVMVQAVITDETPKMVTKADKTPWYDLDGKTVINAAPGPLPSRISPYGAGTKRAIYATVATKRRIVLITPATVADVPPPAEDCTSEVAAAIVSDRAKARIVYS